MSSKFKRILKRIGIGVGLLIGLLLTVNGVLAWRAQHRLESRLGELRALGEPVSLADLAPKPIASDKNAAVYLERIAPQLDAFAKEYGAFYQTPLGKSLQDEQEKDETPNVEQVAAMKAILDRYPAILPDLQQAAACEEYASLADVTLPSDKYLEDVMKRSDQIRMLARYLGWKIATLVAEQKRDEAVRLGIDLLAVARLYGRNGLVIQYLVSVALEMYAGDALNGPLRAGPISADVHAALDRELAKHDDPLRLVRSLKVERAFGVSQLESSVVQMSPLAAYLRHVLTWWVVDWQCDLLDYYARIISLADRPWYVAHGQLTDPDLQAAKHGPLVKLLSPAMQAVYSTTNRSTALLRSLRVLNAVGEYREKNGHEATGIRDLSLSKEATTDPFSGNPLIMKQTAQGWVIYSVFENGTDDSADFKNRKDLGWGPPGYPHL